MARGRRIHARSRPQAPIEAALGGDSPAAATHRVIAHHGVEVEVEPLPASGLDEPSRRVRVGRRSGHVVGDEVALVRGGDALVRMDRRTVLERMAAGGHGRQAVAANLGALAIVVTAEPPPRVGFIDRAAVAARRGGIEPFIVVNKVDQPGVTAFAEALRAQYGEARVLAVSALEGEGLPLLRERLAAAGLAALVGPSGVGKSSLTNRLVEGADLAVGALSDATGRGRHTTSQATLWRGQGGVELIDTPGIRDVGLAFVTPHELARCFLGFEAVEGACRFRDCLHDTEPGCAVEAAAEAGELPAGRLAAYRHLLAELRAD